MTRRPLFLALLLLASTSSCGKKDKASPGGASDVSPAATAAGSAQAPAAPPAVVTPAGAPPADGKYERVVVEGVTVPMVQVMNNATIVLVDTDGKKPRTWEEQYKRKRDLPAGQYDLHKTDVNHNDKFDDDPIDKEGLWVIDGKGNITKH
jgi:hypothetical protein